nr:hypothetical protein [Tanacetum cinerariifolium]
MADPEMHPAYDFFTVVPIPRLAEAPGNMNEWIEEDVPLLGEIREPIEIAGGAEEAGLDLFFVSDARVADSIAVGEIWPIVTTVEGQVQVMASQAVQVVSRLEEIETIVQQVESRVDTYPSDYVTGHGQDVIVGLSQQVQTLQTSLHGAELQN